MLKCHGILLLLLLTVLTAFAEPTGKRSPLGHAREHTAEARALLARLIIGAPDKTADFFAGKLATIEADLAGVKNNKGTTLPLARKAIGQARAAAAEAATHPARYKEIEPMLEELSKQIEKAIVSTH